MSKVLNSSPGLTRRHFMRASGVCLALPWLESKAQGSPRAQIPRRMVCICSPLGIHAENFFPKATGKSYAMTPYLDAVGEFRERFTVISGLSHPDVGASHDSMRSFLTGAPHPEVRAGFENSISVDQLAAERMRGLTRYPTLTLGSEGEGLGWTRSGAPVPADFSPARVFARLFIEGTADEIRAQRMRLQNGRSILDALADERSRARRKVGTRDRARLDEYYTSVRELEQQITVSEKWFQKPKPKVNVPPLQDVSNQADILHQDRLWYDLIYLAIQTDSTRLVTLTLSGITGVPQVDGVSFGYHDLSHHGQDPTKLAQLRKIELAKMVEFRAFLKKLQAAQEEGESLLDRSMVFFSSNLGNASNHDVKNLPVLLAGGGFKHGQHLAFDPTNPPPLCNLYVSMLQRLGLEIDHFASSSGTLNGLVMA
jgi:hypothetical protein